MTDAERLAAMRRRLFKRVAAPAPAASQPVVVNINLGDLLKQLSPTGEAEMPVRVAGNQLHSAG